MKVSALISLYNPNNLQIIKNNIEILDELGIFTVLVDDFSDKKIIFELDQILSQFKNIFFIEKQDNLGIGNSLNLGCEYLKSLGYSWVLTLDQDSVLDKNWINILFDTYKKFLFNRDDVFIFHSIPKDPDTQEIFNFFLDSTSWENVVLSHFSFTSGSVMSLLIWEKLGKFDEELFLDYVDFDLCFRARLSGYKIYGVTNSIMLHKVGERRIDSFLGRKFVLINHSPIRLYYAVRNSYILRKKYGKVYRDFKEGDRKFMIKRIIKTLLFESNKLLHTYYVLIGIVHAVFQKTGRLESFLKVKTIQKLFDIYSFDVFDTLITRKYADPRDPIRVASQKVAEEYNLSWEEIFHLRIYAEVRTRDFSSKEDISFDEIYKTLKTSYPYWKNVWEKLQTYEWEEEFNSVEIVWENYYKFHNIKRQKKTIILLSDMYLSEAQIRSLLEKCNYDLEGVKIYVSSELGLSKHRGGMFKFIREKYRTTICHLGDNFYADIVQAEKNSIFSSHFIETHIHEAEKNFIQKRKWNKIDSLFIGLLRKTRLEIYKDYYHENAKNLTRKTFSDFTTIIICPFILSFVLWLKTQKRKSEKLYFVARDGRFLYEMYKILFPEDETYYLHGSRKAWFLPCMDPENDEDYDWLYLKDHPDTFKYFSKKLEFSLELSTKMKRKFSIDDETRLKQKELKDIILNKDFTDEIRARIEQRKARLISYLLYMEVHKKKSALVDLGWTFKTLRKINKLLKSLGYFSLKGYFVSCFIEREPTYLAGEIDIFLPDGTTNLNQIQNSFLFWRNHQIIEQCFFLPPENSTLDYKVLENKVEPIFDNQITPELIYNQKFILDTIKRFSIILKNSGILKNLDYESLLLGSFKNIIRFFQNKYPYWKNLFENYVLNIDDV